jgi:glycosyltransferase involved in cell wall biosynthesis
VAAVHPEILYVSPFDPSRSAVPNYARTFRDTLGQFKGLSITPLLSQAVPERLERGEEVVRDVQRMTSASIKQCGSVATQVIHVEMSHPGLREFWAGHHAARLRPDCPMCIVFHDPPDFPPSLTHDDPVRSRHPLVRWLTSFTQGLSLEAQERMAATLLEHACVLLALSRRGCELLAQRYPEHRHKIAYLPPLPMGWIPDQIEPNIRKATDSIQLLLFGFLRPGKGIEQAIQALDMLNRNFSLAGRVRFRVRGRMTADMIENKYHLQIAKQIERASLTRVVDLGPGILSEERLDEVLTETDILLLPYDRGACEGASMSLLRAETWCVAPVASDTGSLRELIEHDRDGLLFPVGDSVALADCLLRLMREGDLRLRISRARRERALRERSGVAISGLLLPLYREMLRARDEKRRVRFPRAMIVPGASEEQEVLETGEKDNG